MRIISYQKPLKGISSTFTEIPFIFVCVLIAWFFMANGPSFFEGWDSSYTALITIYMGMLGGFVVWSLFMKSVRTQQEIRKPISKSITPFIQSMIFTYIIMFFLIYTNILYVPEFDARAFWPQIILQFCVIATAEEVMFRGVLLDTFSKKNEKFGMVFSSILFAIWHSTAYSILWYKVGSYSFNYTALFIAFIFGLSMALIVRGFTIGNQKIKSKGLSAAIPAHAIFNLSILGLLFGGI